MSDYNKLLWFLFIVSINTLISIVIKNNKSKTFELVVLILSILILGIVSFCWAYLDFWM